MNRSITLINSLGIVKTKKLQDFEQHVVLIRNFASEYGIKINSKNPVYDSMYLMNYQVITIYTSDDETLLFLPYLINESQYNLCLNYLCKDNKFIVVNSNNIKEIYKEHTNYDEVIDKLNNCLDNYNRINKIKIN